MHHAGENTTPLQGSVLFGTVNGAVGEWKLQKNFKLKKNLFSIYVHQIR